MREPPSMRWAAMNFVLGLTNLALFVADDWSSVRWVSLGVGLLGLGAAAWYFLRWLAEKRRVAEMRRNLETLLNRDIAFLEELPPMTARRRPPHPNVHWREGEQARWAGVPRTNAPYVYGGSRWEWEAGWDYAQAAEEGESR